MDSQADIQSLIADIDRELEDALAEHFEKLGGEYDDELAVIQRWQQSPNQQDFQFLYNKHQRLLNAASRRYVRKELPKAYINGSIVKRYVNALQTFDPSKGRKFSSHVYNDMQRLGRWTAKYSNVGRIPTERGIAVDMVVTRKRALEDLLGREPTDDELTDDIMMSIDHDEFQPSKITPKMIRTIRKEIRDDLIAEEKGGQATATESSEVERQAVFLHGSLNPDQKLILEHTFSGFGKPRIDDAAELGQKLNMSPQRVRAIRKQIQRKVMQYYKPLSDD